MADYNWQRDLLRIALYVAGVVMLAMAIPDIVAYLMAYIDYVAAWHQVAPGHWVAHGDPYQVLRTLPVVAPVARSIAGLLLAWLSHWLSRKVFPNGSEPKDPA